MLLIYKHTPLAKLNWTLDSVQPADTYDDADRQMAAHAKAQGLTVQEDDHVAYDKGTPKWLYDHQLPTDIQQADPMPKVLANGNRSSYTDLLAWIEKNQTRSGVQFCTNSMSRTGTIYHCVLVEGVAIALQEQSWCEMQYSDRRDIPPTILGPVGARQGGQCWSLAVINVERNIVKLRYGMG